MNSKNFRRYMTILLLFLVALGFVSQKYGLFNSYMRKYEDKGLEANIKQTDAVSGASVESDEGSLPQNTQEPEAASHSPGQSVVSVIQSAKETAGELDYADIKAMVRNAVQLAGGLDETVKDGHTVVLKPNLVQKHIDASGKLFSKELNGITTDWRVTKAVAEIVRELNPNGKIYVMEGSAGDKTPETMEYFNYSPIHIPEIDEFIAIEEDSGGWQEFDSPRLAKVSLPNGLLHKEYFLNRRYLEADVLISIPTLKNNSGTVVTGGIKNVAIGATPANIYGPSEGNLSRMKMVSHSFSRLDLQQWLYDYYMCKPVNFVVMDGLEGFQNGPVPVGKESEIKDKMNMRLIIAGKDAVAVDTVECLVTGWDPHSAAYLRYLEKSGMGNLDTTKITVLGNRVDLVRKDFKNRFEHPGWVRVPVKKAPEFVLNKAECTESTLILSISSEAAKAEIYIDDRLLPYVFTSSFDNISISTVNLKKGNHKIKLLVYDRFLNCSETSVEVTK